MNWAVLMDAVARIIKYLEVLSKAMYALRANKPSVLRTPWTYKV